VPEVGEQLAHPAVHVVDDAPNRVDVLTCRVLNRPVLIAFPGKDRARLATAHCDDHVSSPDDVVVKPGWLLGGRGQASVGEHLGHDGVDRVLRLRARRAGLDGALGVVLGEDPGGHRPA
jgi:hypothetical protein